MVTSTGWSIGLTAAQYRVVWQVYGEGSAETVKEGEINQPAIHSSSGGAGQGPGSHAFITTRAGVRAPAIVADNGN